MRLRFRLCIMWFLCLMFVAIEVWGISAAGEPSAENNWKDIAIDQGVFSSEVIRLNMEIYDIARTYCTQEKMTRYFGVNTSKLVESVKKYINPLIAVAVTTAETPNYADRRITWTSAVYTKPLAEKGFTSWGRLSVAEVDSDFYLYNGLSEYFTCGAHSHTADGTLHVQAVGAARNDNDSLGPAQILRRYLYQAGGCITARNADNSVFGVTTDLMRWEDNVVWVLNNALSKFRAIPSSSSRGSYVLQNEYELFVLMAIAHNTGASFLNSRPDAYVSPYWVDADGVWCYARALTTEANIQFLRESYIEPWYRDIVIPNICSGKGFALPGNVFSDGDQNQQNASKLLQELGFSLSRVAYTKTVNGEVTIRNGWASDDGYFSVLEHKQRYPLKSLVNYLALEKLYYSGGENE